MTSQNRRVFLGALLASPIAHVMGANERINVAIIGVGGRGRDHIDYLSHQPGVRIVTVCDVNRAAQDAAAARVERLQGLRPTTCTDMRRVLENKEVDVVSTAAPNHWHALTTVWACQAGKDVYVEKPASHNLFEGRRMIEAASRYGRIVQVGTQSRSTTHKRRAIQLLHDGVIGKVYLAKALCSKRRKSIGHTPDAPAPQGLDWDLFRGPAPMCPYSVNRFQYNWHWFWDTGNGDIGNQGAHELDLARWGLNRSGLPTSVVSTGGKFAYTDDQETPNTQTAIFDYGDAQIIAEVRGLPPNPEETMRIGNLFYGTEGCLALDGSGFRVYRNEKNEQVMNEKRVETNDFDTAPHFANFLEAVRTRNPKQLHADIETGVTSAALSHLANISYRLGRTLRFDPERWEFADADANRMLTREYRAPYVLPDKI
jgi:predicted dehydrogenase